VYKGWKIPEMLPFIHLFFIIKKNKNKFNTTHTQNNIDSKQHLWLLIQITNSKHFSNGVFF